MGNVTSRSHRIVIFVVYSLLIFWLNMRVSVRVLSVNQRSSEIQKTFTPINILTSLVSLSTVCVNTRWQLFWVVCKALTLATILGYITFYMLYIKIRYLYSEVIISIKLTDGIQMCYDYIQYLVDLFFVFKYGREIHAEYYKQYANIDQILVTTNYSAIKRKLNQITSFFAVIWIINSVCDFTAWAVTYGPTLPLFYSVSYIYVLIKMFNTLDLISNVMHVEFRLKRIVEKLQDCYRATKKLPGDFIDSVCNKYWFYCGAPTKPGNADEMQPDRTMAWNTDQSVKCLAKCYLLLCEQCVFINSMFGTRILLNSLSLLIDMIRFTNIAVRLIIGSQATVYASGYYPAAANILRMMTCVLIVGTLVMQCERAYRERDTALAVIDHTLVGKDPDAELRSDLTDLRGLIQSRPIVFHTAHFFRLEYGFLVSLISVMVTYTIILVQSLN